MIRFLIGIHLSLMITCVNAQLRPVLTPSIGHANRITSAALSPDGRFIVTGAADHSIRLWEMLSGKELKNFEGHSKPITSVVFSPNGEFLLSGSEDTTIRLWDTKTGRELHCFNGHDDKVSSVAFDREGRLLLSGSYDGTIRLWDLFKRKEIRIFKGHKAAVTATVFSPDGRSILSGSGDSTIRLWDTDSGIELKKIEGHKDVVNALVFSADGHSFFSASDDKSIRQWNLSTGVEEKRFDSTSTINTISISDDEHFLLSGSGDLSIKLWDLTRGEELQHFEGEYGVAIFSRDGKSILFKDTSKSITMRDKNTGVELQRFEGHVKYVSSISISPNSKKLLSLHYDKAIQSWDLAKGLQTTRFEGHQALVTSVVFSPDGRTALSGSYDNTIRLWDVDNGEELQRFEGHSRKVHTVAFSPDGRTIASGSEDNSIRLWSVSTGKEIQRINGHAHFVSTIMFLSDGRSLLSGGGDNTIRLWETATGQEIRRFDGHEDWVTSIFVIPSDKFLVSTSLDGTIRQWEIESGKEIYRKQGFRLTLQGKNIALSPDGISLLAPNHDQSGIYFSNFLTGKKQWHLNGYDWVRSNITFIPDGNKFFLGTSLGISILDSVSGKELASLLSFEDGSWAVTEPGGRYDSSHNGENPNLHWVVGLTTIGIEQLKERYYDPGLLAKIMGVNKEPLRTVPPFDTAAVKLPPLVSLSQPFASSIASPTAILARIQDEGGGIGRVRVRLNGKEMVGDASTQLSPSADGKARELNITLPVDRLLTGTNTMDVMAFNADNHIQSRLASINLQGPAAVPRTAQLVSGLALGSASAAEVVAIEPPTLYVIAVGVSKYAAEGGRLNLAFSGKDAVDLSQSLLIAGKRLFGAGQVNVRVLTDADATVLQVAAKAGQSVTVQAPGRTQVAQAFADVAKEAKANDIVVVFLGGHGVMTPGIGLDTGDYHYLMPEARSADLTDPAVRKLWAVSSAELTEWTKAIKANKQVLVLDTCAAGGAVDKLVQQRALPGSHTIALERLKDRTGFHILAGSAADKVSYEASRYGQGLLTYALLAGLRGAALRDGEYADVSKLFQYAVDQVPELAKGIGGIQKPMVASPRGSSFDIGRLVDEDKRQVPVAKIMPLMLRSQIQSDDFKDTLRLEARLNARLREFNYAGVKGGLMFVDADEHPDGWKLRARYRKAGEGYVLEGVMFQGEQERGRVKVELKSDEDGQLRDLMAAVRKGLVE